MEDYGLRDRIAMLFYLKPLIAHWETAAIWIIIVEIETNAFDTFEFADAYGRFATPAVRANSIQCLE